MIYGLDPYGSLLEDEPSEAVAVTLNRATETTAARPAYIEWVTGPFSATP